jgi:hypothetical protein
MTLKSTLWIVPAVLLLSPLGAAEEKPPLFPGKIATITTGELGYGVALENVTVVEIAGKPYLRGRAVKTDDERYWYRGKEVLIPEKAVTMIALFDSLEDYATAMEKVDKAIGEQAPASGGKTGTR